ncbi:MAG: helix-turn-helix transcriptional regulator [Vulcanimicrobiaceae bacterium]
MNMPSIVQPLHRSAAFEQAQSLWYAAQYSACLELLAQCEASAERFLLAAWSAYRLRRYDDALASLASGHLHFIQPESQVEADALSAVLYEIIGNSRESDAFGERASRSDAAPKVATASNMLALRAWMRDDPAECLRRLRPGEASSDPNIRAQAISIRSWIHGSRGEFARQACLLEETLQVTLSAPVPDVGLAATTLQTLSHRCRELYLPNQFTTAVARARDLAWTTDLHMQQYHALRHIAWTHALNGQYVNGIRDLTRARELAQNEILRVASTLDSAWVAFSSGETFAGEAHLRDALDRIDGIDWSVEPGEEIWALQLAAELSARSDPRRARELLSKHDAAQGALSVALGARHHAALEASALYTRAVVWSACGDASSSRTLAKQAFGAFEGLGYNWRAARCALLLYRSGCGDNWLAAAKEKARNYPRSFIGAQLQRIEYDLESEPLARLTPRQREIVHLLAAGGSIDEVATTLRTSRNTVRVHVQHIHRALGVRNRAELLKRTAKVAI